MALDTIYDKKELQINNPVMTADLQSQLTPDSVLERFLQGNKKFIEDDNTVRQHSKSVRLTKEGQYPKAVVLSCLDSRIPVEDIFDMGIGDIFVARVAGNLLSDEILGSMEFGCKVSGAKLVMVMGHNHCGAVKGAIDKVDLGYITSLVKRIEPVIENMKDKPGVGSDNSSNEEYVQKVAVANVQHTVNEIRRRSQILNQLEKENVIRIVGTMYDLETGKVTVVQ